MKTSANQNLFNYLSKEHRVDLTENELQEIVRIVTPIVLGNERSELREALVFLIDRVEKTCNDPIFSMRLAITKAKQAIKTSKIMSVL